jgi:hypothetical protein
MAAGCGQYGRKLSTGRGLSQGSVVARISFLFLFSVRHSAGQISPADRGDEAGERRSGIAGNRLVVFNTGWEIKLRNAEGFF